ncbi:hypothetical protein [Aliarcobacter butzleri]|nr:hypothetical protein [Aliarcobacter butzleri]
MRLEKFNIFQKGVEDIYLKIRETPQGKEKTHQTKGVSISSSGVVKKG